MLDFRPHKILAVIRTGGGEDENGVPLPDEETEEAYPCRIEPNGSASSVFYEDGVARNYSFTVYLDQGCREFKKGDIVRLEGLDGMIGNDKEFVVLGFHRYQLNARVWV